MRPKATGETQNVLKLDEDGEGEEEKMETCSHCKKEILQSEIPLHTAKCVRETSKCKICGEVFHQSQKKQHLIKWRDGKRIKYFIEVEDVTNLKLMYEHGSNPDAILDKTTKETAMHFIATFNSLGSLVSLLGAGV